jgi:hypothetical protein
LRNTGREKNLKTSEEQYTDKYKLLMQKYAREKSLEVGEVEMSNAKPTQLNTVE